MTLKYPPTAAFALASQGNDIHSAMVRVAVASLRISNPHLRVFILCDQDSDDAMRRVGDPTVQSADKWIVVDTPHGNGDFRSRFVKTSMRSRIDGPFLFLDNDVVVRGSLDEVFSLDCDVAAAPNHSRDSLTEQMWDQDHALIDTMGWEVSDEVYMNGGVWFCNDTDGARRFSSEWHDRWFASVRRQGSHRDQPAFNAALLAANVKVAVLPHKYNAQIRKVAGIAADAVVWHFYASAESRYFGRYHALIDRVLREERVDPEQMRALVEGRHPWGLEDFVRLSAEGVELGDQLTALYQERASLVSLNVELRDQMAALHQERAAFLSFASDIAALRAEIAEMHAERVAADDRAAEQAAASAAEKAALSDQVAASDRRYSTDQAILRSELNSLQDELRATQALRANDQALLRQVLTSRSWRLTTPLRAIDSIMRRLASAIGLMGHGDQ